MIRFIILFALSFIYIATFSQEFTVDIDSSSYFKKRTKYYIKEEKELKKSDPQAKVYFDSIAYYYEKSPDDTLLYGYNLANIYWQYSVYHNYDKVVILANENLANSKKRNDFNGVALSYRWLAKLYRRIDQPDSIVKYASLKYNFVSKYMRSLDEVPDSIYIDLGQSMQMLASGYTNKREYDIALFVYFLANDVFNKIDNLYAQYSIAFTIGSVYTRIGDNRNSLIQYQKALDINKMIKNAIPPILAYSNMGSVYIYLKQYDTALVYINLALDARLKHTSHRKQSIARLYNNKGLCHRHLNQKDSAMFCFEKSIMLFNKAKVSSNTAKVKTNIAAAYIEWGKYSKAQKLLLEQIDIAKKYNYQTTLMEIYNGLSVIYESTNKYKESLEYKKKSIVISDSIQSVEVKNRVNEYKEKYETELREKDIERLKQESALQKLEKEKEIAEKENQKLISLILIILVIALILVLFFLRRNNKLTRISDQEKFARKEKEKNQKILDLVKNQEVNSINSFIEGQDKERNRIAAELHDRLGSLLSTVKLHFSSFETEIEEGESKKSFNFAIDLLDNSVSEVRSISHNLSEGMITEFGLSHEIENLRDTINNAGMIRLKYIIIGENISINPDRSIEIFRIIQEVVTNAIKHSQSEEIFIQQINNENDISITIEDYGVGFNMNKIKNNGMGLANLQNRANKIGAICNVESAINQGTTVTLEISKK